MQREIPREIDGSHGAAAQKTHDLELVRELAGDQLRVEIACLYGWLVGIRVETRRREMICRMGHRSVHLLRATAGGSSRLRDPSAIPLRKVPCRRQRRRNRIWVNALHDTIHAASDDILFGNGTV